MKPLFSKSSLVFCLLFVVALAACSGGSGTSSGPSKVAGSSPTPISSSADVVKIGSEVVSLPAGGSVDARVILLISPGFHVNANPATFSYLIPTEVTPGKAEGITVGTPVYPAAGKKKFQFAEQPLAVYEGNVQIRLNIRAEKSAAAGPRSLPITVRVQACDEEKCFPPDTLDSKISVTVK
jgi:DsbC/DsbD-like thiol-disulfide interchange protein